MALRTLRFRLQSLYPNVRSKATSAQSKETIHVNHSGGASKQKKASESNVERSHLTDATLAVLAMVAVLHARRLYQDSQAELAAKQGIEPEFCPDTKAAFLQLLPLRHISRMWGYITSVDLPVWTRPMIYRSWARAFHTDLEEVPLPLNEYRSLGDFFGRSLKEGSRPIDRSKSSLLSPVDGIVMRCGRVIQPGAKVEQVKGFTYSLSSLLGSEPHTQKEYSKILPEEEKVSPHRSIFSFWRSPQPSKDTPKSTTPLPERELFYCVLYLGLGDYHRVHSPSNLCVAKRTHFSGNLLPVNTRSVRTTKDLYVLNERVVLEGEWDEGYMAMALVGATNIGSIELKFEPNLKTNVAGSNAVEVNETEYCVARGDEVAKFNMGSSVVMVFEAPGATDDIFKVIENPYPGFTFTVRNGQRVKVGESIGHY